MVRFTVHSLGTHTIDNLQITGPFQDIVQSMADIFLATYHGSPETDLDLALAQHIIKMSGGQGQILEHIPNAPGPVH